MTHNEYLEILDSIRTSIMMQAMADYQPMSFEKADQQAKEILSTMKKTPDYLR